MVRLPAVAMVGFAVFFETSFAGAQMAAVQPASNMERAAASLPGLPPMPGGAATVMGGVIRNVDPVRDEFKLKVFGGGHPVKMLFDARTQVYRDGKRVPLSALSSGDHASVETTLDGSNIFALRIHMLSQMPEGECQGQVVDYNPANGELKLMAVLSREPIMLRVPSDATIVRVGQTAFASGRSGAYDLTSGSLVSVKFRSGSDGHGVADHIAILATPGSSFAFSGNITALDLRSGRVVLVDPRDSNTYEVFVNPLNLRNQNVHVGQHVNVTAKFDGNRYVASAMR